MFANKSPVSRELWDILIVCDQPFFTQWLTKSFEAIEFLCVHEPLTEIQNIFSFFKQVQPNFVLFCHCEQDSLIEVLKEKYPQFCAITVEQVSPYSDYHFESGTNLKQQLQNLIHQRTQSSIRFSIKGIPLYQELIKELEFSQLEMSILNYLSYGHNYDEVGQKMALSANTIRKYTNDLREKVNAKDKFHLICIAFRGGLIA